MPVVNCSGCGKFTFKYPYQIKNHENHYCSHECRQNRVVLTCPNCEESFSVPNSESDRTYCSMECMSEGYEDKIRRTCKNCGGEFHVSKSTVKFGGGVYCSEECMDLGQRKSKEERVRNSYGVVWERQRGRALERDNYECQSCGISQEECREEYKCGLHVHHIVPYRKFEDESAHELDNLEVLCPSCHMEKEHKVYGDAGPIGERNDSSD